MRRRHHLGDQQIIALWDWTREMQHSYHDMNFTPPRFPQLPHEHWLSTAIAIRSTRWRWLLRCTGPFPKSALWVLPHAGHGPVFMEAAAHFAQNPVKFLKT